MDNLQRIVKTATLVLQDNVEDLVKMAFVPRVAKGLSSKIVVKVGQSSSKWLLAKFIANKAVDGAILKGFNVFNNSGAKFAIPKGLPTEESENTQVLAIQNEPHVLDGFDGVIAEGYGKGTKRIIYKGRAIMKVKGRASVTDIEYHIHDADRAGLHYDLAVKDLPSNESIWELNIGKGPVKGRYAFVNTARGYIATRMKDRGLSISKPTYILKQEEFLDGIKSNKDFVVERKYDGSLINVLIYEDRAIMHSHRDQTKSYYDKLPEIEFLKNNSKYFLSRTFFPSPKLDGTVLRAELVHPDGSAIVSGILNSAADNAVLVQRKIGIAKPYVWDVLQYKGLDVSNLPYLERRKLLEDVTKQINIFNKNWQIVEKCPTSLKPRMFYDLIINDRRGLPYSEGVVVKSVLSTAEDSWYKVKRHDLIDMEIIQFQEGEGKHIGRLGSLVAKDTNTGNIALVGTGLSDFERNWIWEHKDLLEGAVIKVKVFEQTEDSFRAPRFVEFHADKQKSEVPLLMYADVLAGLNGKKAMLETKYKLING